MRSALNLAALFALVLALFASLASASQIKIEPNAAPPPCSVIAVYKAGRAVNIFNDKTGTVEPAFVRN